MSLVLFDSEAAEAAPAAISCFERIIVVGMSLTFELSATSSSNSTMYAKVRWVMKFLTRGCLGAVHRLHSVAKVYAVLPFYDVKCLCSGGWK